MTNPNGIRVTARNMQVFSGDRPLNDACLLCEVEFKWNEDTLVICLAESMAMASVCFACAGKGVMALISRRRKKLFFPPMTAEEWAERQERKAALEAQGYSDTDSRPTRREYREMMAAEFAAAIGEDDHA